MRQDSPGGNPAHFAPEVAASLRAFLASPSPPSVTVDYGKQAVFELGVLLCETAFRRHPLPNYPADYCRPPAYRVTYTPEQVSSCFLVFSLCFLSLLTWCQVYCGSDCVFTMPLPPLVLQVCGWAGGEMRAALAREGYPSGFLPLLQRMVALNPWERIGLEEAEREFTRLAPTYGRGSPVSARRSPCVLVPRLCEREHPFSD